MTFESSLTELQQRIIALLLAAIPVAAAVAMLISYASDIAAHRELVALLKRERAHYQALAESEPVWSREIARLRAAAAGGDFVLRARTADDAARQLQAKATNIVTTEGGSGVQGRAELNANGEDGPVEVRSDLSFTTSIASLTHILFRLRQARPLLIPTRLSVRSTAEPTEGAPTAPNPLQVDLLVVGYTRLP